MDSNFVRIRFEPVSKFPTRNLALMVPAAAEAPPVCTQNCRGNVSLSLSFSLVLVSSVLRRMVVENGIFITTYTCTVVLKAKVFDQSGMFRKPSPKLGPQATKPPQHNYRFVYLPRAEKYACFCVRFFFSFFCLVYFRPSL